MTEPDRERLPPGGRWAGAGLVAFAALSLAVSPAFTAGRPAATALYVVLVGLAVAVGAFLALRPDEAADRLRRLGGVPTVGAAVAVALLTVDVLAVLGMPVVYAVSSLERIAAGVPAPVYRPHVPDLGELAVRRTVSMTFWVVPILLYLALAERRSLDGIRDDLRLRGGAREVLLGLVWTVPVLLALPGLSRLLASLGLAGGGGGTIPVVHAVLISVTAGVGEEIFFRGFMQRRIGFYSQAVWFGVEHAAYLSLTSMLGALVAGLIFGLALRETDSLVPPIVAHVTYDILILTLPI